MENKTFQEVEYTAFDNCSVYCGFFISILFRLEVLKLARIHDRNRDKILRLKVYQYEIAYMWEN